MDGGSYFSGSYDSAVSPPRRERSRHRGLKALAGVTAGAVGLEAWRRHRRRSQEERRTEVTSSRRTSRPSRPSGSFIDEEKFSEPSVRDHTWRNRLLGAGAAAGGIAAIRGWMNRRNRTEVASDVSSYTHGPVTAVTQEDVHRVQAGHAPASPAHTRIRPPTAAAGVLATGSPLRRPAPRRSGNSVSSFTSLTEEEEHVGHHDMHHDEHHDARYGVREGITALGVAGFGKYLWDRSRRRREDRRSEEIRRQDRMQEEIARRNSHGRRYTGDGSPSHRRPRPPAAGGSIVTLDDSALTGSVPALSHQHLPRPGATPGPSTLPVTPLHPPPSNIPMPPPPGSTITSIPPPPPPISDPMVVHDSSGSEAYTSPGGGHHRRHRLRDNAAAGAALGAATAAARPHSQDRVESPPVSVKVKMHNDGRHVTLRRLNEQEAAAEREARRRERRRRNGSLSSLDGGNNTGDERWRRVEAMEAAQAAELAQAGPSGTHPSQHNVPPPGAPIAMPMPPPHGPGPAPMTPAQAAHAMHLPPPPPIPGSGLGGSAVGGVSPPSAYGTETDLSNYENNRRRRRAERMKAKAAQGSSGRVEFQ